MNQNSLLVLSICLLVIFGVNLASTTTTKSSYEILHSIFPYPPYYPYYNCSTDLDCNNVNATGFNSKCYQNKCICNFGYKAEKYFGLCVKIMCDLNKTDCEAHFPLSHCSFEQCICDKNATLDTTSQACKPHSSPSCKLDSDCYPANGDQSKCYQNECICLFDHILMDGKCRKFSCKYSSDCWSNNFYNTGCQNGSCVCYEGTSVSWAQQICRYPDPPNYTWRWVMIGVVAVIGTISIISLCCKCCKKFGRK